MCGRCRQVFNAFESLKRVEDDALGAYVLGDADRHAVKPTIEIEATSAPLLPVPPTTQNEQDEQDAAEIIGDAIQKVDVHPHPSTAVDSGFIGFTKLVSEPVIPPLNEPLSEANAQLDDEDSNANAVVEAASENLLLPDLNPERAAEFERAPLVVHKTLDEPELNRVDQRDHPEAGAADETKTQAVGQLNDDNPKWLRAKPVRLPRHKLWLVGSLLLLIVLAAQASLFLRAMVIDMYPQTRPHFVRACDVLGCTVSWGRDSDMIKIVESDLIEPPGKPGRLLVTATLANRAVIKQDLPALELRLTDNANQILVSRVLQPADYMGRQPLPDEGIAPNAELFINLNIESSNKNAASGYGLRAYYQ